MVYDLDDLWLRWLCSWDDRRMYPWNKARRWNKYRCFPTSLTAATTMPSYLDDLWCRISMIYSDMSHGCSLRRKLAGERNTDRSSPLSLLQKETYLVHHFRQVWTQLTSLPAGSSPCSPRASPTWPRSGRGCHQYPSGTETWIRYRR